MRIILTARQSLIPHYEGILTRLVNILGVIAKNPSNPHFDQYTFESLAGLMRCVNLFYSMKGKYIDRMQVRRS